MVRAGTRAGHRPIGPSCGSWPDEAVLGREPHGSRARRDAEPRVRVGQVTVHGVLADHEPLCHLAVRQAVRDERQHLDLACGETGRAVATAEPRHEPVRELERRRGITIHDIRLPVDRLLAYNDFSNSAALIDIGHRTASAYLDAHIAPPEARYAWLVTRLLETVRALGALRAPAT